MHNAGRAAGAELTPAATRVSHGSSGRGCASGSGGGPSCTPTRSQLFRVLARPSSSPGKPAKSSRRQVATHPPHLLAVPPQSRDRDQRARPAAPGACGTQVPQSCKPLQSGPGGTARFLALTGAQGRTLRSAIALDPDWQPCHRICRVERQEVDGILCGHYLPPSRCCQRTDTEQPPRCTRHRSLAHLGCSSTLPHSNTSTGGEQLVPALPLLHALPSVAGGTA